MFILGFVKSSLLATDFDKVNNNEGNNIKFENIATNKVTEINPPKATVPPNSDIIKTENPKKSTMDV